MAWLETPRSGETLLNALLINTGSSSLKFHLASLADHAILVHGMYDWAGQKSLFKLQNLSMELPLRGASECFHHLLGELAKKFPAEMKAIIAVAHRVVHGGNLSGTTLLDDATVAEISRAAVFAPLHNPSALEVIAQSRTLPGNIRQFACLDTAFHSTMKPAAFTYPVPNIWTKELGLRRYGFHGLNVAWCAERAAQMLAKPDGKLVVCHLGHGASATAVVNGHSVFTTMGLTPLDGLMMGTRSGSIDPGIIFHLARSQNLSTDAIEKALLRESGLLGVSGKTADMREIVALADNGDAQATLALEMYCLRVQQAIGSLAATMGGLDSLVFTAGVGENAPTVREKIMAPLAFLGLELDGKLNSQCKPDMDVSAPNTRARVLVIAAREELQMLREITGKLQG
jgi:acetate kinase